MHDNSDWLSTKWLGLTCSDRLLQSDSPSHDGCQCMTIVIDCYKVTQPSHDGCQCMTIVIDCPTHTQISDDGVVNYAMPCKWKVWSIFSFVSWYNGRTSLIRLSSMLINNSWLSCRKVHVLWEPPCFWGLDEDFSICRSPGAMLARLLCNYCVWLNARALSHNLHGTSGMRFNVRTTLYQDGR